VAEVELIELGRAMSVSSTKLAGKAIPHRSQLASKATVCGRRPRSSWAPDKNRSGRSDECARSSTSQDHDPRAGRRLSRWLIPLIRSQRLCHDSGMQGEQRIVTPARGLSSDRDGSG